MKYLTREKNNSNTIWNNNFIPLAVFSFFVFGVVFFCGTWLSGYHLIDDHEFFSLEKLIEKNGLVNAAIQYVQRDLTWRFRPMYLIFRIVGVFVLGTSTYVWSVLKAGEIALAMWLLYLFARDRGTNIVNSYFFAFLCGIGEQMEIFWRLGPQESMGMVLFAGALLCSHKMIKERKPWHRVLYMIILFVLAGYKESFLLCIPGIYLLMFAFFVEQSSQNGKDCAKDFFKRYCEEIIFGIVVFFVDLWITVFYVGTNKTGYAGFSNEKSILFYLSQIFDNMFGNGFPYLVLVFIFILIAYVNLQRESINKIILIETIVCIYIFGIQQLLHAMSGMDGRYFVPWVFSISYFVAIIGGKIIKDKRCIQALQVTVTLFLLLMFLRQIPEAVNFTKTGNELHQVIEWILDNSSSEDSIVAVSRDSEIDNSFGVYMECKYGYITHDVIANMEDDLEAIGKADILFSKGDQMERRMEEIGIDKEEYNIYYSLMYQAAIKKREN